MPKLYIAEHGFRDGRFRDSGEVTVIDGDRTYPLDHFVRHSPDGFAWGYGGSGSTELARCILIDVFGGDPNDARVERWYHRFTLDIVARWDSEAGWSISEGWIRRTLASWARGEVEINPHGVQARAFGMDNIDIDAVTYGMVQASLEELFSAAMNELGDSRFEGFVVLGFWSGGRISAGEYAVVTFASPELNKHAIPPHLRTTADQMEEPNPASIDEARKVRDGDVL